MIYNWIPEKIFLSHSSKDKVIVDKVEHYLRQKQYNVYVSERKMVGYPLIYKLKKQLLDSNAMILTWTKNANLKSSSQIIAFEIGMAFSLGIPIYILYFNNTKTMPWFFKQVTDYQLVKDNSDESILESLNCIEETSFFNPIDVVFPKENLLGKRYNTANMQNIRDGVIYLKQGDKKTFHYTIVNRKQKQINNLSIDMFLPFDYIYKPGNIEPDKENPIQRMFLFDVIKARKLIRLYFRHYPIRPINFEVRFIVPKDTPPGPYSITVCSECEDTIGIKRKYIPIMVT